MTVTVETGAIVSGANSYVTEAGLVAYAAARGVTIALVDAEELIVKSMDYIESLAFKGVKLTQNQPLQWPRADVYVDDYLISVDDIPSDLTKGQYEVCLAINNGEDPLADVARAQQSVKVGSLSVTYASGSSSTTTVRKISSALRKLLVNGGSGSSFTVKR